VPAVKQTFQSEIASRCGYKEADMASVTVKGMSCNHCKESVTKAIAALPEITDVHVDLVSGKAEWHGDESARAVQAVKEALLELGFEAE